MNIAVYTAIFGHKDELKDPINYTLNSGTDYFLITDNKDIKSKIYEINFKKAIDPDIAKNARYYKIMGLEELNDYDYVIWHDANLQLRHDSIPELIKSVQDKELATFAHPNRTNFYDEAVACIRDKKEEPLKLFYQCLSYFRKNISPYSGLYETSILVKNNNIRKSDFYNSWWEEIRKYSRRDQISLPYILNKWNISPGTLHGERLDSPYAVYYEHQNPYYVSANHKIVLPEYFDDVIIKWIETLKKLSRKINSKKPLNI